MKGSRTFFCIFLGLLTTSVFCQCLDSTVVLVDTDFELDDGGLMPDIAGDWEWGVVPTVLDDSICTSSHTPPPGAFSGLRGWGTNLTDCYFNSNAESTLVLNIDLTNSQYYNAELSFMQWHEVFVSFDFMEVRVNGNVEYFNDTLDLSPNWYQTTIGLDQYLGSTVTVEFAMFATAVVNRAGWYIDDVSVTTCFMDVTGINDVENMKFLIGPNPANDLVRCTWSGVLSNAVISIRSLNGSELQREHLISGRTEFYEINISDLRSGAYLITLETGGQRFRQKFIKL